MAVLESYIEKKVIAAAEAAGFMQRKVKYINRNGAPDRWFFGPAGQLIIIAVGCALLPYVVIRGPVTRLTRGLYRHEAGLPNEAAAPTAPTQDRRE